MLKRVVVLATIACLVLSSVGYAATIGDTRVLEAVRTGSETFTGHAPSQPGSTLRTVIISVGSSLLRPAESIVVAMMEAYAGNIKIEYLMEANVKWDCYYYTKRAQVYTHNGWATYYSSTSRDVWDIAWGHWNGGEAFNHQIFHWFQPAPSHVRWDYAPNYNRHDYLQVHAYNRWAMGYSPGHENWTTSPPIHGPGDPENAHSLDPEI